MQPSHRKAPKLSALCERPPPTPAPSVGRSAQDGRGPLRSNDRTSRDDYSPKRPIRNREGHAVPADAALGKARPLPPIARRRTPARSSPRCCNRAARRARASLESACPACRVIILLGYCLGDSFLSPLSSLGEVYSVGEAVARRGWGGRKIITVLEASAPNE